MRAGWRSLAAAAGLTCVLTGWPLLAQEPGGALAVAEHGVGSRIADRALEDRRETFTEGETAVFWTLVTGGSAGDAIHHVWIHDGQEVATVDLAVDSPRWRTWSRKTLHPGSAGGWAVEARDGDGKVLARDEFTCSPPE